MGSGTTVVKEYFGLPERQLPARIDQCTPAGPERALDHKKLDPDQLTGRLPEWVPPSIKRSHQVGHLFEGITPQHIQDKVNLYSLLRICSLSAGD